MALWNDISVTWDDPSTSWNSVLVPPSFTENVVDHGVTIQTSMTSTVRFPMVDAVLNAVVDVSIDGSTPITLQDTLRLMIAFMAGKLTIVDQGGGVSRYTYRNPADTVDRLQGDVRASDGNRTGITIIDPS